MGTIINRVCAIAISAVLSFSSTTALAQGDCDGWVPLHDLTPRTNPMLVSLGATALLHGGSLRGDINADPRSTNPDTWRFDGHSWQFVTMNGPRPTADGACAYDSDRQALIIHGGNADVYTSTGGPLSDETWEFRAGQWHQIQSPIHPPAMIGHAMVYDPARHVTLLPNGRDLWRFNGTTWSVTQTAIAPPGGHRELVYDPSSQTIVMVPYTGAAWRLSWSGTAYQWTTIADPGVSTLTSFYDEGLQSVVLLDPRGRFYTFSGSSPATQLPLAPPFSGTVSGGAFWPVCVPIDSGWLVVVNSDQTGQAASYIVTSNGWTPIPRRGDTPTATEGIAMAFDEPSASAVLFGGKVGGTNTTLAETWTLRGERWSQVDDSGPPARVDASMGYVPARQASILVGGSGWDYTRMWLWQNRTWQSQPFPSVAALSINRPMNIVFDPLMQMSLLGRGVGFIGFGSDDVTLISVNVGAESVYQLVFDAGRQQLLDVNYVGVRRLTTSDSGLMWFPVTGSDPLALNSRVVYEPDRGAVVRCGGSQSHQVTTFLPSNASTWQPLPTTLRTPFSRSNPAVVYDSVARRVVMYGGRPLEAWVYPLRETWKLARGPAAVALEPVDTFVIPGETAEVFIIASGGGVIQYQWFKDGVALANSDRITGADSDTLQIQNFTSDDNGEYHVTVHNPCGDDQSIAVQVRAIPACPGDFNDSGGVDTADLGDFFNAYERGLMLADVDLSGGVDATDMAVFLESFQAGGC